MARELNYRYGKSLLSSVSSPGNASSRGPWCPAPCPCPRPPFLCAQPRHFLQKPPELSSAGCWGPESMSAPSGDIAASRHQLSIWVWAQPGSGLQSGLLPLECGESPLWLRGRRDSLAWRFPLSLSAPRGGRHHFLFSVLGPPRSHFLTLRPETPEPNIS